jgi:hypothetical protein
MKALARATGLAGTAPVSQECGPRLTAEERRWSSTVFSPTKRRHISYYLSLPFVVAIVFLLVAKLTALQRAEIVANLADQVAHQEPPEAAAALRRLAAMPRPPVDVLAAAATSADPELADEAQIAISGLLRRCQRKIESQKGLSAVARQLDELSTALAQQHEAFSTADYQWLASTAKKILRLANQLPPGHSPLVAVNCDTVLATIAAREAQLAQLASSRRHRSDSTAKQQPAAVARSVGTETAPVRNTAGEPRQAVLQREFTTAASPPLPASLRSSDQLATSDLSVPTKSTTHAERSLRRDRHEGSSPALEWSYPMINSSPAMPIHASTVRVGQPSSDTLRSAPVELLSDAAVKLRPLADVDSRELLRRWLECENSEAYPLEEELTYRGFGRLSARLVEQLFSPDAADRLRLVDDVLVEPGIDARPWLVLLADDEDADVRLLVVTIMATSDDAMLLEKAWQVAIKDHDPRIASLAGRLRDRRDSAQQR